jgi:hypothetical protein
MDNTGSIPGTNEVLEPVQTTVSLVVGFRGDSLVLSFRLAILLSRQFSRVLKPWREKAERARRRGGGERAREMISFGSDRMFYFLRNVRRCFPFLWNGSHDPFVPNKLRPFLFKGTEINLQKSYEKTVFQTRPNLSLRAAVGWHNKVDSECWEGMDKSTLVHTQIQIIIIHFLPFPFPPIPNG